MNLSCISLTWKWVAFILSVLEYPEGCSQGSKACFTFKNSSLRISDSGIQLPNFSLDLLPILLDMLLDIDYTLLIMVDDSYKKALEVAQQELATLHTQRAELDARIARLRETVVSLAKLIGDEAASETYEVAGIGLTDAVAKVLRLSSQPMTPAQIRDELARMGYDINKYTDIIPSILKVLQRLHEKGHVDIGTPPKGGRKVYIWSPMQPGRKGYVSNDEIMNLALDIAGKPPTIDAFSGKGSTPIMLTNPPYPAVKKSRKK